ncbi:ankyrin repeat domain-containing protein [Dactylosporangium sp. NPDC049742]|uniref:ankyrin repeat domain-containing protein n=1 Tax=Dactylosporangium sp. NPDC049742 TaxID=3154737 RepID=UPI00341858F7
MLTMSELRGWRTARRYAVPAAMIRHATDLRLAGDWRGACAAADVEVDVDLIALARRHGTDVADRVEADVRHLAPDLLRWHLPRRPGTGKTALSPRRLSVLARYGEGGPVLYAGSPRSGYGRQRLRLIATADAPERVDRCAVYGDERDGSRAWYDGDDLTGQRHLWDARRAGELLAHYGLSEVPGLGPPDVTATATLIQDLQDTGFLDEALDLLGVEVVAPKPRHWDWRPRLRAGFRCRLPEMVREIRRAGARSGATRVTAGFGGTPLLAFEDVTADRIRMTDERRYVPPDDQPYVALDRLGVPIDALLLRLGLLAPDELHPLVHAAFLPGRDGPPEGPPGPVRPSPVRVRCRGEWHEVLRMEGGAVRGPHSEEERQRGAAPHTLGGSVDGCFAVAAQWRTGTGRLPRRLRELRRELMQRALHGDAEGVTALLDEGVDPHVRDDRGRTLLHLAAHLDDLALLDRLLTAGLDVNARDLRGVTPLHAAVHGMGDVGVIRALVAAGADRAVEIACDEELGEPIADWAERVRKADRDVLGPLLRR